MRAPTICPHPQLRDRNPSAPMGDLPFSPSTRIFSGDDHAGRCLFELGWEPVDGVEFGAFLLPWFTPAALRSATLPIILTLEDKRGKWRPVTLTAESLAVPGEIGLFAARGLRGSEMFESMLDGELLGEGTAAKGWQDAIVAKMAPADRLYLYTLRVGPVHYLFDGSCSRLGGPTRANDALGTGLRNNCELWDTGAFCVLPHHSVPALTAGGSLAERRKSEVLWDYGASYWALNG